MQRSCVGYVRTQKGRRKFRQQDELKCPQYFGLCLLRGDFYVTEVARVHNLLAKAHTHTHTHTHTHRGTETDRQLSLNISACFACFQEFRLSGVFFRFIPLHLSLILFENKVGCSVNSEVQHCWSSFDDYCVSPWCDLRSSPA